MKKLIIFFLALIVLHSCNEQNKMKGNSSDAVPTILTVDVNYKNRLYLSEFVDSVKYIKLETTKQALLSDNISKIRIIDSMLILFDYKKIYVFDINGKFEFTIGNVGEGPGEYTYPYDFNVDKLNQTVEVLDLVRQKIIIYKLLDGSFANEFSSIVYPDNFMKTKYGNYLIEGESYDAESSNIYSLFLIDTNRNIIDRFILEDPLEDEFGYKSTNTFSEIDDNIYFSKGLSGMIYCINNGEISLQYKIDFSSSNLDLKNAYKAGYRTLGEILRNTNYVIPFTGHLQNERYLFYNYHINNQRRNLIYDKDNKVYKYGLIDNDLDPFPVAFITGISESTLIGSLSADRFISTLSNNQGNQVLTKPEVSKLIRELKPSDNPLIVFYYLKSSLQKTF